MTLQQLDYIVAVNNYRQFSKAAESCGVTQPTLSAQVLKLEEELGVPIFDRKANPLRPTMAGELMLKHATAALQAANRIAETAQQVKNQASGVVRMGMVPSIAPYLMPPLVQMVRSSFPEVEVHCTECEESRLVLMLQRGELDMTVMSCPDFVPELLSIPLYTENIVAYLPTGHRLLAEEQLSIEQLRQEQVWGYPDMLRMVFGDEPVRQSADFADGSLYTLVALADANGGVLLAPQTIIDILLAERYDSLRPLEEPAPSRLVQLYVRQDYVMEQMLNVVGRCVCEIVPEPMLDSHLKRFGIKL